MPESIDKIYSNFTINRRQAQTLAFLVLSYDVEQYISEHKTEYEQFLLDEENKQKGVTKK